MARLQSSFSSCQLPLPCSSRFLEGWIGLGTNSVLKKEYFWLETAREAITIISYFQAKNKPVCCLLKIDSQQFSISFGKLSTAPLQNAGDLENDAPRSSVSHSPEWALGSHSNIRWSSCPESYIE